MTEAESYITGELHGKLDFLTDCMTEQQRRALLGSVTLTECGKGVCLYTAGNVPTDLKLLVSGKCVVYIDGVSGRRQIVRLVSEGSITGCREYFSNSNYTETVLAIESSVVANIPFSVIDEIMNENHALAGVFLRIMSEELELAYTKTISLTQKHIRGRMAEGLLWLADTFGYCDDGATLAAVMSRAQIASLTNMITSNAIRTLSAFAAEGLVELRGKNIVILNKVKLANLSRKG